MWLLKFIAENIFKREPDVRFAFSIFLRIIDMSKV